MYNIKNEVFQNFTPRQKSALFSYIKSLVKKYAKFSKEDITDKFIEDENYYYEIKNPHFEFIIDFLSDDNFIRDLGKYIEFVLFELSQKEKMKPVIEKQKQLKKVQRMRMYDHKMSKLEPTQKQIKFYKKITSAHGIPMKPIEGATRLDLKNWIMEIIEPKEDSKDE